MIYDPNVGLPAVVNLGRELRLGREPVVNTEDGCVRKTFGPFGSVCLMRVRAHRNESAAMDVDHYSIDFFGQLLSLVL